MLTSIVGVTIAVLVVTSIRLWMLRPGPRAVEGAVAPDFSLQDQGGTTHRLHDYAGHWLVLYFYPRDATPLCTREACAFRDAFSALGELDASVLGVSVDSADAHGRFARQHALPFPLLSDTGGQAAAAYGCLLRLGFMRVARRRTFVIAPDGRIAARFDRVDPTRHAGEVMEVLGRLQRVAAPPALVHDSV